MRHGNVAFDYYNHWLMLIHHTSI